MGKLDGNIALITGAGRGIGKAMALRYAREAPRQEYRVNDLQDVDELIGALFLLNHTWPCYCASLFCLFFTKEPFEKYVYRRIHVRMVPLPVGLLRLSWRHAALLR